MAYPYITTAQLNNRLSARRVQRLFDDDGNGTADTDPVNQLIADASSKVAGYLRGVYDLDLVSANPPHEVIRLTLDVAFAMAAQRFPEVVRVDWQPLMSAAEKELDQIRKGFTRLDSVGVPEPGANQGGSYNEGDPALYDASSALPVFSGQGFGIF